MKANLENDPKAKPDCSECNGIGIVILENINTQRRRYTRCSCVQREEPEDDLDAWSGGFTENH